MQVSWAEGFPHVGEQPGHGLLVCLNSEPVLVSQAGHPGALFPTLGHSYTEDLRLKWLMICAAGLFL